MLLEMLVAQVCVGLSGQAHEACTKAVEATAVQYQIKQNSDKAEKMFSGIAEKKVTELTGRDVAAVVVFAAKSVHDKQVSTRFIRNDGYVPSVTTSLSRDNGSINFGWYF